MPASTPAPSNRPRISAKAELQSGRGHTHSRHRVITGREIYGHAILRQRYKPTLGCLPDIQSDQISDPPGGWLR